MLEEYIKRLENLIVPHNFNKTNFRDKIKAEFEDPSEIEEKKNLLQNIQKNNYNSSNYNTTPEVLNNLQLEDERKLVEEYIQKMGVKDGIEEAKNSQSIQNIPSSDNKLKLYQKILENEGSIDNVMNTFSCAENGVKLLSQTSKSNKTYSLSPSRRLRINKAQDEVTLRERVHTLNIKSMNFRHEVELLKTKIGELNMKIDDQQTEIGKLEKQKESNNKYLIKLETLLAHNGTNELKSSNFLYTSPLLTNTNCSKINNSKILNLNATNNNSKSENLIVEFNKLNNLVIEDRFNNVCVNLSDRNEIKDFIYKMMSENQKLKAFQSQVFEISKKYDDINENMIEGMKHIQQVLNSNKKENEIESENNFDENSKKDIINNFENLIENVEKTIEIKQSEYNFLIESKDQEMKFLQDEIIKLNENIEYVKRDRLRDQKVLNDYETELSFLTSRMEEMHGKQSESLRDDHMIKLQKKIAPVRSSVNKIVKKFERAFDLQDKNNVKMLSNIAKNIK